MKKPIIAIDIDDVLSDSAGGFIEFSNREFGTTLEVDDYNEYLMEMWGVDLAEQERRVNKFFDLEVFSDYNHKDRAFEVLNKLKKRYDLIIVTSRRTRSGEATKAWLELKYPGIFTNEKVFFTGFHDSPDKYSGTLAKGQMLKELGASYLIEDQVKHCISAVENGLTALLYGSYKWNQADELPDGVVRVSDWDEVEKYFNERA